MDKLSRRKFFQRTGLAGAGALLPLGRSRTGVMLKRLIPPEEIIPGVSYWLCSTCGECPAGCGVEVRVREGNAVKIEGNERHPINHGGLCARGQSALQALYSPARIRSPFGRKSDGQLEPTDWSSVTQEIERLRKTVPASSEKTAVVTSHVTGGLRAVLEESKARMPSLSVIVHEPLDYAAMAAANKLCFGIDAVPTYEIARSRTVVSFGADMFETWLSPVSNAHEFAASRRPDDGSMSRLVQIESHLSLTGANADDRYSCPPGAETLVAMAIASLMLTDGTLPPEQLQAWRRALEPFGVERAAEASGIPPEAIKRVADRLRTETPGLAVAGGPSCRSENATAMQVAVNLINVIAEGYGTTLTFDRVENAPTGTYSELLQLVEDMEAGRVGALIVHETNPEFTFPQPERWRAALKRVPLKVQLSSVRDDSTELYDVALPVHHWLERWDWLEPRSGLNCVQQPVVKPLYDSRGAGQTLLDIFHVLSGKSGEPAMDYEKLLHDRWEQIRQHASASEGFEDFWREVLASGGCWLDPVPQKVALDVKAAETIKEVQPTALESGQHALLPVTTVRYGDGRQTGRPWLHELPDPVTTIAWDTPACISPATAKAWKCRSGDVVRLECGEGAIETTVYVQVGTSDAVVVVPLGAPSDAYAPFHYADDVHPLHRLDGAVDEKSGALSWAGATVTFKEVVGRTRLARMQGYDHQDDRRIAQAVALNEVGKPLTEPHERTAERHVDLYPKHEHPVYDWTMAIDLSACIGCGACAVACQAENNVPVVGKQQCLIGREMSWLRIERFIDRGRIVFLPMLCQECEHAPCETVCPVYAAVHSSEGLNLQIYNRCVGTRYCANNCPYKVRRFNWYTFKAEPPLDRQFNPDISMRTRGIMEKCTFCVQRIREHKEIAKDEERALQDGEVVPACAQSCPTGAIHFGDLNDPASRVAKLLGDPRGYTIFAELNTQPSIVYLKRIYHPDAVAVESV